jgi:hypothetical protein
MCLLSLFFSMQGVASGVIPDAADREFLNRAVAASDAELKIARMAPRNAGREEILALAQRLATYHARLSAALREFARLRKTRLTAARNPKLDRLLKSFEGKKGRAYDDAFRDLLTADPAGLIPLYGAGAATASDRLLRRLAERVYGELKGRRPAAARAHLRQQVAAAQEQQKIKTAEAAKAKAKAKGDAKAKRKPKTSKATAQNSQTRSPAKRSALRRGKASRDSTISEGKHGTRAGAAASPAEQTHRAPNGFAPRKQP